MLRTCIVSLVLIVVSLSSQLGFAEDSGHQDLFQKGLADYQSRKYEEARTDFEKLLDQGTISARLLHNLALTYFQMNQKPRALALWRKALVIDPSFRAARAGRDMMESRFNMRPFERDSFNLWLRRTLEFISFYEVLWLMAFVLSGSGWLWIRYSSERRQALDEDQPLPAFPVSAVLVTVIFFFCVGLTVLKSNALLTPRGTVVSEKASVRSLPSDDGVPLFEIGGGMEVLIRRQENGWKQIQNADGNTGWIKDSDILVSSKG